MHYLSCVFDHRRNRPLYAASFDSETNQVKLYQLYFRGVKFSLFEAYENAQELSGILANNTVALSDFKSWVEGFNLDIKAEYDVHDICFEREPPPLKLIDVKKAVVVQLQKLKSTKLAKWQSVLANSALVYSHLERAGYYYNYKRCYSTYDLAYSGRSKCLVNNIQGATDDSVVEHIDEDNNVLIHFDWIAADFRMVSLISEDPAMQQSFENSDPYTALYEALDDEEIDRDKCKMELFRSLYSLNYENPSLEFYPVFAEWMRDSIDEIEMSKHSRSLLGRQFHLKEDERTLRSVFNAQIQGSVAHAMQNTLYQVYKIRPGNILAEIHDSLVLACKQEQLTIIIKEVSQIMLYPLDGILQSNPKFPVKVSVGLKWKQWKPYKEFR